MNKSKIPMSENVFNFENNIVLYFDCIVAHNIFNYFFSPAIKSYFLSIIFKKNEWIKKCFEWMRQTRFIKTIKESEMRAGDGAKKLINELAPAKKEFLTF